MSESTAKRETPRCDAAEAKLERWMRAHDGEEGETPPSILDLAKDLETELQQLRLAADGMRELAVSFQGLLDKAQVAPGVQPGSDTFTRYNITTNGRDLERMKELIQSKIAAYRAAGEGLPKDTGTSRE